MFKSSLRNRMIILLLLVTVIPFSGSIYLTYSFTIESLKNKTVEENALLLFQGKSSIQNYLEGINRLTLSIYKNSEFTRWIKSGISEQDFEGLSMVRDFLSNMFQFNDDIEQVFLYLSSRQQAFSVSSRYVFNAKNLVYDQSVVIEKTKASNNHTYLQTPHKLNYHGLEVGSVHTTDAVLSMHRMLIDPGKTTRGYLSIDVNMGTINHLLEKMYHSDGERFYLTDPDGNLFYPYDASEGEQHVRDLQWFQNILQLGEDHGYFYWEGSGFDGVIIYDSLPESLGGLLLVKQIPFASLYRDVHEIVKLNIYIGLVALFLVVIATFIVSFRITGPIRVLLRNIKRIESGDMEVHFRSLGRDEIGILGARFKSMINTINHMIIREYRMEIQNKTNQLKVLQSQINPHFLHNALQSIGTLAMEKDVPEVYKLIRSLSNIMRYSMETSQMLVPVGTEVDYVREYLKLQKERYGDKLSVVWKVDADALECLIPKMTIQPLAENYFKHSFDKTGKKGILKFQVDLLAEEMLFLSVEDNGIGISEQDLDRLRKQLDVERIDHEMDGIGLVNVYSRLRLYFGDRVSVRLKHSPYGGLAVEIRVPAVRRSSELAELAGNRGGNEHESDSDRR